MSSHKSAKSVIRLTDILACSSEVQLISVGEMLYRDLQARLAELTMFLDSHIHVNITREPSRIQRYRLCASILTIT